MADVLQGYVYGGVPGLRTFEYSTSASGPWTAITVTGYKPFLDWLFDVSTQLVAAGVNYALSYDADTDRVRWTQLTPGTTYAFRLESESMRVMLGWNALIQSPALLATGANAPRGIVPLDGFLPTSPTPSGRTNLRRGRWGQSHSVPFGKGLDVDIECELDSANLERMRTGPCGAGRVRIGPTTASAKFSGTNLGGYLDGTIIEIGKAEALDSYEGSCRMNIDLHIETAPASGTGFWDALEHGYSLMLHATIEGISRRWCEMDPGWSDPYRTVEDRLWMDPTLNLVDEVQRLKGVANGSGFNLAIRDPFNDTEVFGKARKVATLAADLTVSSTEVEVDDVSGWSTADSPLYIGKEEIAFTGIDSGTNKFTGLTRGVGSGDDLVNPLYEYRTNSGVTPFATVADRPFSWVGRVVETWGTLMDPYGNPVGSSWTDEWSYMLHLGEVTQPPRYSQGVWAIGVGSLVRRATRSIGSEAEAKLWVAEGSESPWVIVHDDDAVTIQAFFNGVEPDATKTPVADYPQLIVASSGSYHLMRLGQLMNQLMSDARALTDPSLNAAGDYNDFNFQVFYNGEEGVYYARHVAYGLVSDVKGVKYVFGPASETAPYWLSAPYVADGADVSTTAGTGGKRELVQEFLPADRFGAIFIESPDATFGGEFPTSGYAVIDAGEEEVISYSGVLEYGAITALVGVERRLYGTKHAKLLEGGTLSVAELYDGSIGEQIVTALQSSGTGLRGTFDTKPAAAGYGLDDAWTSATWGAWVQFRKSVLVHGRASIEKIYGDLLALLGLALTPKREGQRLRLGIAPTVPSSGVVDLTVTDRRLSLERSPDTPETNNGPNIATLKTTEVPGVKSPPDVRMIASDSVQARGGVERTFEIPVLSVSSVGFLLIGSALWQGEMIRFYRLPVSPGLDCRPGMFVQLSLQTSVVWDPEADQPGITSVGIITRAARALSGECSIDVAVSNGGLVGALCPAVEVTALASSTITVSETTFPGGQAMWEDGAPVLLYQAGVSGNYTETTITGISGSDITLASVPSWLSAALADGAVFLTYPSDDAAGITDQQDRHTHYGDGTVWG